MSFRKGLVLVTVMVFLIAAMAGPSYGQTKLTPPPDNVKTIVKPEALQLIAFFDSQISQVGSEAKVKVNGTTITQSTVDYIGVRLNLQKWDGSAWVELVSVPFEDYGTDYVSGTYYYQVARGYYYRVKGIHFATRGTVNEETLTYTQGILIQ